MTKMSKRMKAVAAMVTTGNRLADVGTDHGYVPIHLVQEGRVPSAIAMDINEGPLERADKNIAESGLQQQIKTVRCDGLTALQPGEVDTILIAGMGGELTIHILTEGEAVCRTASELVLQPQSELYKVRKYLREQGYRIVDEDMILEDGKYYPMMRVINEDRRAQWEQMEASVVEACDSYGPILLKNGNPILRRFLVREHKKLTEILKNLDQQMPTESVTERRLELEKKLRENESAYTILGDIAHAGI